MAKKQDHKKQQKQMKKKQKAKDRKSIPSTPDIGRSYTAIAKAATNFPIDNCYINVDWNITGLAQITIKRRQPDGGITFAALMVDTLCLGVKDTMLHYDVTNSGFSDFMMQYYRTSAAEEVTSDFVHQLIYQAIDYAAQFGLKPHRDFTRSQQFFTPRDKITEKETFVFGRDGKPTFISGPYDNVKATSTLSI